VKTLKYYTEFKKAVSEFGDEGADTVHRHYRAWSKTYSPDDGASIETSMRVYIESHTPERSMMPVCELLEGSGNQLVRWIQELKIHVVDTVRGYYISDQDFVCAKNLLKRQKPVRPDFQVACEQADIPYTYADFHAFVRNHRNIIDKYRYHPLYREEEYFYDATLPKLESELKKWSMIQTADRACNVAGYCSLAEMAEMCGLTPAKLVDWLEGKAAETVFIKGQVLIRTGYAESTAQALKRVTRVSSVLPDLAKKYPELPASTVKRIVTDYLIQNRPGWLLEDGALPWIKLKEPSYIANDQDMVCAELIRVIGEAPVSPLVKLRGITGLSDFDLIERIQSGVIHANKEDGTYLITVNEIRRIRQYAADYIVLDHVIEKLLLQTENDTIRWNKAEDRRKLTDFLEENHYWGLRVHDAAATPLRGGVCQRVIHHKDVDEFIEKATLAVKCVGQPSDVCCRNILDTYQVHYPRTIERLREFLNSYDICNDQRTVNMLDFLMYQLQTIGKELDELDDDGITRLVTAYLETPKTSGELFVQFLRFGKYTNRAYRYDSLPREVNNTAYPAADFAVMVAYVVNEGLWAEADLVHKALAEAKYAELWLNIALHIFAAWRSTDFARLSPPPLRYPWEESRKRIVSGTYTKGDAEYAARTFVAAIQALQMRPNKTHAYSQVPPLIFLCPEDCLAPLGMILSIAAIHYYEAGKQIEADPFVTGRNDLRTIRAFFGEAVVKACGYRNFSGRRANKSVLQSISATALEEDVSPYLSYLLASLMRSHKGGCATLAQTTEIYLRDANFAGQDPNYIAYQMFQRGVCSFAVDLLLKQCYGERYNSLTIEGKTECIALLGVSNDQLDQIKKYIVQAQDDAIAVVTEIVAEGAARQPQDTLAALANGHGCGKDRYGICIAKAAKLSCRFPERQKCLGCRYEVKTKALLLQYISSYDRLQTIAARTGDDFERRKAAALSQAQLAAISEIVYHLNPETTAAELEVYRNLLRGMQKEDDDRWQ